MTRHNRKKANFINFGHFQKISLILSASTPPSYLVVIVLLGIYPRYVLYTAGVTFPNKVRFGHCMRPDITAKRSVL